MVLLSILRPSQGYLKRFEPLSILFLILNLLKSLLLNFSCAEHSNLHVCWVASIAGQAPSAGLNQGYIFDCCKVSKVSKYQKHHNLQLSVSYNAGKMEKRRMKLDFDPAFPDWTNHRPSSTSPFQLFCSICVNVIHLLKHKTKQYLQEDKESMNPHLFLREEQL